MDAIQDNCTNLLREVGGNVGDLREARPERAGDGREVAAGNGLLVIEHATDDAERPADVFDDLLLDDAKTQQRGDRGFYRAGTRFRDRLVTVEKRRRREHAFLRSIWALKPRSVGCLTITNAVKAFALVGADMAVCRSMDSDDSLSGYECRELLASETGWIRALANNADVKDGETFAIAVHLPGKEALHPVVSVFDLFLDPLPDRDTVVRRRAPDGETDTVS